MGKNFGFTVKELKEACEREIKEGNGDRYVLLTDDDECNGLHTLFYLFTVPTKDNFSDFEELDHDGTHTMDNSIVLG